MAGLRLLACVKRWGLHWSFVSKVISRKTVELLCSSKYMITMDPAKCTFGIRMPIDLHMLNEIIYREVKHLRNYKTYRPSFGVTPVTGKFHAAHDQLKELSPEESIKIENYFNNVAKSRAKGPRSKYPLPITENQTYGWYPTPLLPIDRNDHRLYHPMKESNHTKTEVMIKMANPRKRS